MWVGAVVMLIQTGVGLWAALQLLKATKLVNLQKYSLAAVCI